VSYRIPKQVEINEDTYIWYKYNKLNLTQFTSFYHLLHNITCPKDLITITFHTFTLITCSEQQISSTTQYHTHTIYYSPSRSKSQWSLHKRYATNTLRRNLICNVIPCQWKTTPEHLVVHSKTRHTMDMLDHSH